MSTWTISHNLETAWPISLNVRASNTSTEISVSLIHLKMNGTVALISLWNDQVERKKFTTPFSSRSELLLWSLTRSSFYWPFVTVDSVILTAENVLNKNVSDTNVEMAGFCQPRSCDASCGSPHIRVSEFLFRVLFRGGNCGSRWSFMTIFGDFFLKYKINCCLMSEIFCLINFIETQQLLIISMLTQNPGPACSWANQLTGNSLNRKMLTRWKSV